MTLIGKLLDESNFRLAGQGERRLTAQLVIKAAQLFGYKALPTRENSLPFSINRLLGGNAHSHQRILSQLIEVLVQQLQLSFCLQLNY
jgi:hypothetical protein